jgi:5,5'-dehydrodivanillate O-demethylase
MLSAARNDMLTRVGPGTPMGNLLRRYWMPIGGASELAQKPTKPARFFGEDLTLYKDLSGRYGLIARHCQRAVHRAAL